MTYLLSECHCGAGEWRNNVNSKIQPAGFKGRRVKNLFHISAVLVLLLGCTTYFLLDSLQLSSDVPSPAIPKKVLVAKGASAWEIASLLEEEGIVRQAYPFFLLALFTHRHHRLHAGEYLLKPSMVPRQILEILEKGRVHLYPVTVPEGTTLREVANLLEQKGLARGDRVLELSRDPDFLQSLGIKAKGLEGYLFPDTYFLPRNFGEDGILRMMAEAWTKVFTPERLWRAKETGLTRHQVLTLASLIEKEVKDDGERTLVSMVYHNRLRKGMRLQCDPTVIYALGEAFQGNLTREDLSFPSPYNTYLRPGLPPGPICNPGEASLQAALYPAQGNSLYFVSQNNGRHYFSVTLKEHRRAVRKYQPKRKRVTR